MIVFNGYLTGKAEQHFRKRSFQLAFKICLLSTSLMLPVVLYFTIINRNVIAVIIYLSIILFIPLAMLFTKSKKEWLSLTPKNICVKEELLICLADKFEVIRNLRDVKIVYDFTEFYEIVFRFSKVSEKFICQKNLISTGSIQEFERIFPTIIVKKDRGQFSVLTKTK